MPSRLGGRFDEPARAERIIRSSNSETAAAHRDSKARFYVVGRPRAVGRAKRMVEAIESLAQSRAITRLDINRLDHASIDAE